MALNTAFDAGILGPPPRTIEAALAARIVLNNWTSRLGWLFLGMGSFFFWAFVWHADLSGWRFAPENVAETQGDSLGCVKTRYAEGGSKYRRGTPVYENRYRFVVLGQVREGSSYIKGLCLSGGPVTVEYLRAHPEISRIVGMRRDVFGPWTALVLLFPATGLVLAIAGIGMGRKHLKLLRDGLPAPARLVETIRTAMQQNNRTVYKMIYEYSAAGYTGRTVMRTNRPNTLPGGPQHIVVYDPQDPARAALLTTMPVTIARDELGRPVLRASGWGLLLAVLAILANAAYLVYLIGR